VIVGKDHTMTAALASMAILLALGQAPASETANPSANAKARAVLDYLVKLPKKGEKRILSGQFTDYGPGAKLALCEEAFRESGHWPAMIGLDYADYSQGRHRLHTATVNQWPSIMLARGVWSRSASTYPTRPTREGVVSATTAST
jgi:hypothetical protein